jgi:integrase
MKVFLTDRLCDRVKPTAAQIDYHDETVQGLTLRVSKTGVRTFTLLYKTGGRLNRMTLGRYPEISLAKARGLALEAMSTVADGEDPKAKTEASVQSVWDEYAKREGAKLRSFEERERTFKRLVLPTLGPRPIDKIKRSEIVHLLDRIEDDNGPRQAQAVLLYLSKLFNRHAAREDNFVSPIVRGMARINAKERERTRILSDDELRKIWAATASQKPYHRCVRFMLLTAARLREATDMPWSEVEGDVWTIPGERMKGKQDHVVPLTPMALAAMGPRTNYPYVFTAKGLRPLTNISELKAELDQASGVTGWTNHDLRRSARSLMARAGISAEIAERCMAHKIGGVAGIYNRHAYLDEKRDALTKLASLIGTIVHA